MASIFKRGRDKGKRNAAYYVSYTDHNGRRRTAKGFTDKHPGLFNSSGTEFGGWYRGVG